MFTNRGVVIHIKIKSKTARYSFMGLGSCMLTVVHLYVFGGLLKLLQSVLEIRF